MNSTKEFKKDEIVEIHYLEYANFSAMSSFG